MATLNAWAHWQTAQGLATRTIDERRIVVASLATHADVPPLEIQAGHIIDFLARPHLSQSSKASYHATLRAFYKWAHVTGQVNDDPTAATPRPRRTKGVPRPVRTQHVTALLTTVNRRRTRGMITLAAYAGLRVHEIAKFRGEDLDHIGETITVTGKGGKTALIPAHPVILELAPAFPRRGFWFPSYDTQSGSPHVTSTQVGRVIGNAMKRAGFDGTAHQLRHWYASTLLDEGVDVRIVKEMMRHESLASTEIYTRVSMKRMFEGIERLPRAA